LPQQHWLHERSTLLRYPYISCLIIAARHYCSRNLTVMTILAQGRDKSGTVSAGALGPKLFVSASERRIVFHILLSKVCSVLRFVVSQDSQTRPKPSDFSGEKILSLPSFGGEVKPSVPCRRFAAFKKSLQLRGSRNCKLNSLGHFSPIVLPFSDRGLSRHLCAERAWRRQVRI
jgi:hypothetical protein